MAPSHVPSDHLPLQGQSIYTDSSYESLFPQVSQYGGAPSWDQFNQNHTGLLPQASNSQSWHHNSLPQQTYNPLGQSYVNPAHAYQNTATYPYGQFNNHGAMANYRPQSAIDPTLGQEPVAARQQQQSPYQQMRAATPQGQSTVTPHALQHNGASLPNGHPTASPFPIPRNTAEVFSQRASSTPLAMQPVSNPKLEVPKGKVSGGFSIIDQAVLAKATKSTALNKLVNFGSEPLHLAANKTALPMYQPRQSMKVLKKSGAGSKKILEKLAKRSSSSRLLSSKLAGAGRLSAGSPSSLKREVSDSDSYTDSSDESEYTDDEDDEPSPLPASRPDEPHAAVRYDVIKATWFPRKSQPSGEKIRASVGDIWEALNTIQKRWRADSKAVAEAEEQKKTGELPVLKSRVASQRDLLETALKAALEFGHPDVLYHMGQVKPFLYMCYQFLANRFKAKEYDSGLCSVIYEVLARASGTLTTEVIEETKLIKALNSMKKNANEQNKSFIQQIIDGAAAGSKKAKVGSPPKDDAAEPKNAKRPAAQPVAPSPADGLAAKKLRITEPLMGAAKRSTVPLQGAKSSITTPGLQKRPGEKPAAAPVKNRVNQVSNKPSTFFSTLSAANKKPAPNAAPAATTKSTAPQKSAALAAKDKKPTPSKPSFSFAETMAQLLEPKQQEAAAPSKPEKKLPPETPEEKAKRLRKESRRHLRVTFKPDASLVSIQYFDHHPEEETGHDENFVRDAGDIGGEGRMFKQHREMEDDDDDDEVERSWAEPTMIDFTNVEPEARKNNYEPFGGGERKPECPEKEANKLRENLTLMVFYTHQSDIPASPREPTESTEQQPAPFKEFGPPPQYVLDRTPKPPVSVPIPDFSNLENMVRQLTAGTPAQAPQPAVTQSTFVPSQSTVTPAPPLPADLSAILSALQPPAATPQAAPPAPNLLASLPPPPSQPLSGFDLSAFLSVIQQGGAVNTAFPSLTPNLPAFPPPFPQQQQQQQQPQQQQQQQPQQQPQQQQPPMSGFSPEQQTDQNQHTNGGTKRQREDSAHSNERGSYKRHRGRGGHHSGDRPHKVIPCKFFQKGQCNKGDDCTFIHDRT